MVLIIHSTNDSMKSLMKLTSLLLVETLSNPDYIVVNVSNKKCTDDVVPASSLQRQLTEHCITTTLDATSGGINSRTVNVCQEINR